MILTWVNKNTRLLAILLLAFLLRFFRLGALDFWIVEAKVVSFAQHDLKDIFSFTLAYRPIYLLLAKFWMYFFGTTEIIVRSLPVFLGVISVVLIYKVGSSLWDRKSGLISAFILAISAFNINFSREARGDLILMVVFVLASFYLMLEILKKDKPRYYFYNLILNVLILFTHPYGFFWIITQNFCYLIFPKPKNLKRWLTGMCVLFVFITAWYLFICRYRPQDAIGWFSSPNLSSILETFEVFGCGGARIAHQGFGYSLSTGRMLVPRILFLIYINILLLELLFVRNVKPGDRRIKTALLIWLLMPILLAYLYSMVFQPIYMYRYLNFASPAFYLIIASFLARLKLKSKAVLLTALFILSLFCVYNTYYPEREGGYKDITKFIKDNIGINDVIVLSPGEMLTSFMYYYDYGNHRMLGRIDDEFGMKINGVWQHDFNYKNKRILCLPFGIIKQFSEHYNYESFGLEAEKGVCFVFSPQWPNNEKSKYFEMFLKKKFRLAAERFFAYENIHVAYYIKGA